ncbi:MAG: RNA polymerase sigma factor [Planctomycetes bacterium]|nr:RNA polymerase sigma factor [Planctomycetota bacterium]
MTFASLKQEQLDSFAERLREFGQRSGEEELTQAADRLSDATVKERDQLSTALMRVYRDSASNEAFGLLYELNNEGVMRLIFHHLRRSFYAVDAADVLQEVFFNIYRYPFKFKPDRPSAFRNWTHSIIRNTVLKHSRKAQRNHALSLSVTDREMDENVPRELEDVSIANPLDATADREAHDDLVGAWSLYLHFYLHAYRCLTPREKRALYLVEADGLPYKEAAAELDVRVENLKMMIFRARRKIFTIMKRQFSAGQNALDRQAVNRAAKRGAVCHESLIPGSEQK